MEFVVCYSTRSVVYLGVYCSGGRGGCGKRVPLYQIISEAHGIIKKNPQRA